MLIKYHSLVSFRHFPLYYLDILPSPVFIWFYILLFSLSLLPMIIFPSLSLCYYLFDPSS